ncbi:MAG TPA: HlyD family efflux transporter periplasmic adaptor subunit [Cyclobacteriaceae bacterium]|nr:HlyD family efflux transporter periplasmic adaptor subunit [Cyclobacteriaceae bacterium]HMV09465.1 HlyD family efflux transporter periplasmic adaptor subunit [Cyclobacteriaceae bacterium]HMV89448.1 HlyD family efflux transporter periplasmic adaptor subunit [Cyclobacteriaceae bacterium]HMX02486.1 HlyD family efflux transporter periplasmic adaptor subunit [Cyclobacteriaceae bacterium]HMX52084.1 HlyD family efflux transporter periplasmic adaptor subunit [Cyclobacteriaceae bacterium]
MDKQLKKKKWTLKRIALYGGIAAFVLFIAYQFLLGDRRPTLVIEKDKITIATVGRGIFQDYIPQTGTVEPSRTVYLDAVEGGTIKRIVAESGAMLKKGDVIMELTNLNRELTVLQQEASFNESINRARETRLNIMRNDLEQRQTLATIQNQLDIFEPQYLRQKQLFEKKLISKQEYEQTKANYEFNKKRMQITYEVYRADSVDRIRQLKFTAESERKMMTSLDGLSKILDNLTIRAPIDGQLARPQLEVGQNINQGQRLGQVDILGSFKVRVEIDEIYLPRIQTGLKATTTYNNKDYVLSITYVYPDVAAGGRFAVDMNFVGETPPGIRRGQSLRLRIELGQSSEELLLAVGGFYKDTGGNWVFVLDESGNKAVKRNVKLGRKNTENFEVLEGLKPGDKVITSSYENFGNNEVLILK